MANLNKLKKWLNKQNYNEPDEEYLESIKIKIRGNLDKFFGARLRQLRQYGASQLKRNFYSYKKNINKRHKIHSYTLKDLNPSMLDAFNAQRRWALDLITSQNDENKLKLERRFMDWVNLKTVKAEELPSLALPNNKKIKFILKDQTSKMNGSLDKIVSDHFGGALAFQWQVNNDNRVVGKPGGVNPKPTEKHGDHWNRRNKWYYNPKQSKYLKAMGVNLSKFAGSYDSLSDGMPGMPIGCRCWAYYVYDIEDLPREIRV